MFDRFTIAEVWYLYLSGWHGGQGSKEYARLSRLLKWFKPAPNLSLSMLDHDAAVYYCELVHRMGHVDSGYSACACRDCMEVAFDGGFCNACHEGDCGLEQECRCESHLGSMDEDEDSL